MCKVMLQKTPKAWNAMEKIPKFDKRRTFNKALGPKKNPKLINVGPTFIPEYRVHILLYQV